MKQGKQQGVALITALLVVSIAVILATALVDRLHFDIRRTENIIHNEQAYVYSLSMESFLLIALKLDKENNDYDSKDQLEAANTYLAAPVEGGEVAARVEDLQGLFNLNNLSKTINASGFQRDLERFQRLLTTLELNPVLGNAVVDWLDADAETTNPDGAEDDYYYGREPAYRAANTLMSSPSELRLIKGFHEDEVYEKLLPFITTLQEATNININTAPAEVLKSLSTDLTDDDVSKIIQLRDGDDNTEADPFETADEFKNYMQTTLKKNNFSVDGMGTASDYFLMRTFAHVGQGNVRLVSIIHRTDKGESHVINRAQGNW
ncbi:MAG TPA: type II secretion system minor pseudopilin GspK [Gammaproteobacteria bacterium]